MGIETIGWIFTVFVSPIITNFLKKWKIGDQFSTAINAAVSITLYLGFWFFVSGANPETFQEFFMGALAAAGIGSAGYNVLKSGSRAIMKSK